MFNARPAPRATAEVETIVPAGAGYSLLLFHPDATVKPSMTALLELMPKMTYPVLGFQIRDGVATPITVVQPSDGAWRYLFVGSNKIYSLDTGEVWTLIDQWQQALLTRWQLARQVKPTVAQPPRQLVLDPGQSAVIRRSGYF